MSKFFNPAGQYKNGYWRKKKYRLPRKYKKWVKLLDLKDKNKFKSTILKPVKESIVKSLKEHRVGGYRFGNFYFKQVFKYKNIKKWASIL